MSEQQLIFGQPNGQVVSMQPNYGGGRREAKKVDAYINIALPRTDGKDGKIDRGLRLYFDESDPGQKQLAELLQTPEGIEKFKAKMIVTCNIITGEAKAGFDL